MTSNRNEKTISVPDIIRPDRSDPTVQSISRPSPRPPSAFPLNPKCCAAAALDLLEGLAVFGADFPKIQQARHLINLLLPCIEDPAELAFKLLVQLGHYGSDENLSLKRHLIPETFPPSVQAELEHVVANRHRILSAPRQEISPPVMLSIDDSDTTEVDDALSVQFLGHEVGWQVGVHIADAAAFVPHPGEIGREAATRGATLYLPNRKITMLPSAISEGIGSLTKGEARLALSFLFQLSPAGDLSPMQPVLSRVCTTHQLTYHEADAILKGQEDDQDSSSEGFYREENPAEGSTVTAPNASHDPARLLCILGRLTDKLREERLSKGALDLDLPGSKVIVSPQGEISVAPVEGSPARRLVAEMMILTCHHAAKFLKDHQVPALYRTQPPHRGREDSTQGRRPAPTTLPEMIQTIRSLPRAEAGVIPGPHAGLGVEPYVQITSPLRRYVDLLMQRQLKAYIGGMAWPFSEAYLQAIADQWENTSQTLSQIERESKRYWVIKYLSACCQSPIPAMVVAEMTGGRYQLVLLPMNLQTTMESERKLAVGEKLQVRLQTANPRKGRMHLKEVAP